MLALSQARELPEHPALSAFLTDCALNFFTAYTEGDAEHGERLKEVSGLGKIACRYLKGWFWIDFFSSLPWDLLMKGMSSFRALKVAKLAVSLGGTETLASHPASMTHLSVPHGRRQELGITDSLVRISIGIEDPDDLIADFEQALEAV